MNRAAGSRNAIRGRECERREGTRLGREGLERPEVRQGEEGFAWVVCRSRGQSSGHRMKGVASGQAPQAGGNRHCLRQRGALPGSGSFWHQTLPNIVFQAMLTMTQSYTWFTWDPVHQCIICMKKIFTKLSIYSVKYILMTFYSPLSYLFYSVSFFRVLVSTP